jgi:hypothetical protein
MAGIMKHEPAVGGDGFEIARRYREARSAIFLNMRLATILETLQAEAILFADQLRAQRNALNFYDFDKGTQDVQNFFRKVKSHEQGLGSARMVRILRHQTPAVRGLDKNKSTEADLEQNISWVEAVQTNLEYELEVIDRKRTLILTVASVVAASAAAIASVVALFKR